MNDPLCHCTSALVEAPAATVLAFMADPERLERWSFGTRETRLHGDGLVEGRSAFDGETTYVRIEADAERGTVRYFVGASPDALAPRIVAHVVPGDRLGREPASAVLTLLAWRSAGMSDERWRRLIATHEFEILLVKSLIERAAA